MDENFSSQADLEILGLPARVWKNISLLSGPLRPAKANSTTAAYIQLELKKSSLSTLNLFEHLELRMQM